MIIKKFVIADESEADDYLKSLLEKHECRSIDEVMIRAREHIKDGHVKNYFINKAKEILKAYP